MPWTRKRMLWTIAITALATLLVVVLSLNFVAPEKKLERKIEHRYAVPTRSSGARWA
jgi:cardiolipin synthase